MEQQAFEERICREIESLLAEPRVREFAATLFDVVAAQESAGQAELLATKSSGDRAQEYHLVKALIAWFWKPRDPRLMIEQLHEATERHLASLYRGGERIDETDFRWRSANRLLGYVVTCAVSRAWLESHPKDANPYQDIPLERVASIGIVSARQAQMPACFALGAAGEIGAPYCLTVNEEDVRTRESFVPETGWRPEETVRQIEVIVYRAVFNQIKDGLSAVDREDLNETLKIYRKDRLDPRDYHAVVERGRDAHPLHAPAIIAEVKQRLPELPVIRFGGETEEAVLVVPEGVLIARVRHFLKIITNYG